MKSIMLNSQALRAACFAIVIAAGAGVAKAAPAVVNPPFVQSGSTVTTPGASGTYNNATFQDGTAPYTVTISPAAGQTTTLNNGGAIVLTGDGSTITVANGVTLTQTAGGMGALDINGSGTINNSGSLTSQSFDAIDITGDGTINSTGAITGHNFAITIGGNGSVTSSGTITANGNSGITIGGVGTIVLNGMLTAYNNGITVGSGNSGNISSITINNALTATNNSGIVTGDWATITVSANGSVASNHNSGIDGGNHITLTNAGTITAGTVVNTGNDGVIVGSFANITNTGTITSANNAAISAGSRITVNNSGTLQGRSFGVIINGSNTVIHETLNNSGSISGNTAVDIGYTSNVTNSGTVTSTGNAGMVLGGRAGDDENISNVTNSGTVTGSTNGLLLGGVGATRWNVVNSGTITGTSTMGIWMDGGTDATPNTFTNNGGSITGGTNGIFVDSTGCILMLNAGTITGTANMGLYLTGTNTIVQGGGSSVIGGNDGIYVSGNATLTLAGSVVGQGNAGVYLDGATNSIVLPGGSISGPNAAIIANNANTMVSVVGRSSLTNGAGGGGLIYDSAANGTLNLQLVGITPAELAAFNAALGTTSGDLFAGGNEYKWQNFLLSGSAISLEQVADPGLQNLAVKLDSTALPAAFDSFYVAAATGNPEAAMNNFTGREFLNAFSQLGLSDATTVAGLSDTHANDLRFGSSGLDFASLNIQSGSLIASLGSTHSVLDHLSAYTLGGTTMSDSKEALDVVPANSSPWAAWVAGTVTIADESNTGTNPGYTASTGSPAVGVDYRVFPELVVGGLFNFTTAGANFSDGSRVNSDSELFGVYADWTHDHWFINTLVAGGFTSFDQRRVTLAPGAPEALASPDGNEVIANITSGYDFKIGGFVLSPDVGLLYTHLSKDSFSENGAGAFDLNVGSQDVDSLRTKLGFEASRPFTWDQVKFVPELHATWYHECLDDTNTVSSSLAGAPGFGSFQVTTNPQGRDFALAGAGLSATPAEWHDNVTFFLNYDAQAGQDNFVAHTVNAGLRIGF